MNRFIFGSLTVLVVKPIEPPKMRWLRATTDYKAKDDAELSFSKGEMILYKGQDESGYVEGTLNGKTGFFPVSVVEECVAEATVSRIDVIHLHLFSFRNRLRLM